MRGIVGFDLLRLDGYMAMETEELDGKLYVDTIIIDPVIEQCETRAEAEKAYDSWRELLPKELEHPFRKVLSYMREKRWRKLIFNYFDHRYTNAYVEATNNLLDEISRGGRGYDLETLRAKALLKYGTKRLIDIYDFSIRLNDPDYDKIMNTTIGHGVNLSTLECDLRAGLFD